MTTTREVKNDIEIEVAKGTRYQSAVCRCGQRYQRTIGYTRKTLRNLHTSRVISRQERITGDTIATCSCGRTIPYRTIEARRTKTPCDSRCTGSKGHVCNCSCAGANHGRGER